MNVVPTRATKRAARIMLTEAQQSTGYDAALRNIHRVPDDQIPALVALLLQAVAPPQSGRMKIPVTLSESDRRRGYSQYRMGIRNDFTKLAMREYQRLHKRRIRTAEKVRDQVNESRGKVA